MFELPTVDQYSDAAAEIRATARRMHSKEIRNDLFELAERYGPK